jgi:hypothetical protein
MHLLQFRILFHGTDNFIRKILHANGNDPLCNHWSRMLGLFFKIPMIGIFLLSKNFETKKKCSL